MRDITVKLITVKLFGRPCYAVAEQPIHGMEARKVQELFIYLLLHRAHPCSREALVAMLWEERDETHARKYLRQALWQLQGALERACYPHEPIMQVDSEWVQIHPQAPIWLDVEEFERAYTLLRLGQNRDLSNEQADALCRAVGLYEGDLLGGWYQDWCIFERERLLQMYLVMLDALIDHAEQMQDYAGGVHFCELALRKDPARERTHRRLMRLYCAAGNRSAALRQYELCVNLLQRELNVGPSKSTEALYEQIRSDQIDVHPHSSEAASDSEEMEALLHELTHLQSTLLQTLQQMCNHIDRMEKLMQRRLAL